MASSLLGGGRVVSPAPPHLATPVPPVSPAGCYVMGVPTSDTAEVAAISSSSTPGAGPRRHQKARCKKCKRIQWRTVHDAPPGQLPTFLHKRCKRRLRTPFTVALEAAKARCGGLKKLLHALAKRGVSI